MAHTCTVHATPGACMTAFAVFAPPREDNSVCTGSVVELRRVTPCLFEYMKKLLIRLRRTSDVQAWIEFRVLVEQHLDTILELFDGRWLVSVLDTYVDHADPVASRNALVVTSLISYEKFVQTRNMCFHHMPNPKFTGVVRHVFASGLDTFVCGRPDADMPANFFKRLQTKLRETPVVHAIFKRLMHILLTNPTTIKDLAARSEQLSFVVPYNTHVLEL